MSKNNIIIAVLVLVIISIGVWGVSSDKTKHNLVEKSEKTLNQKENKTEFSADIELGEDISKKLSNIKNIKPNTIEINGNNFNFSQKEIRVKKGDVVKIKFKSTQGFHDFVIDEFNIRSKKLNPQDDEVFIEFTADKIGAFEYYCSVGLHRQLGMIGRLIVE